MKNLILIILFLFTGRQGLAAKELKVGVKGMVCAFCAQGIEKNFMSQPEVAQVEVSLANKYVILTFKDGKTLSQESIAKILKEAGYQTSFENSYE
jgi:mercuric ion binding protein